ncbi:LCP family protein [Kineosporia sp. J2-2]|uniref:LCP family protein n=1 Tax=Kineosporia corallincola TaxID=2835133 RepID=A0ABS5TSP2_9ACTN|nr:LCP family protein [Kineosporia corallincola]MBT0773820.1 LCP family protein [Kineosporia corallincola]
MTQVEPFSRRPRRPDSDQGQGEQRSGHGRGDSESRYGNDSGGGYDPRPRRSGSRSPGGRGAGYDTREPGNGGYEPRPGRENREPREGRRSDSHFEPDDYGSGPRRGASAPPPADDSPKRGSHATTYGQGFSWVVLWTILGALIPGAGLIAAGWRRLGIAVLGVLAVGAAGLAFWALSGNILERGVSFAVDAQKLLMLAIAAVVIGLLWALIILLTNSQLRRYATLDGSQKIFSWVVVAALLVGVGVPTYTVSNYSLVQRDLVNSLFTGDGDSDDNDAKPDSGASDPWAGTDRINVLLIGSDAGSTRTGIRPDTLIVASIQPSTGNTVLFSLPRNLQQVPFREGSPGAQAWPNGYYCPEAGAGAECMLNAIWRWAEGDGASYYSKYKNPGLRATEDAVTGALGLEIDTYAMLNLEGFADFIDAIGGLTLNVYERLPIGGNSSNPVAKAWIEVGENQNMDGYTSLWFARSRWSTDDYDRMRRQRCVIAAVTEQADPVTIAKNWTKIAKALKSNMETGIPQSDIQAWVELATRVQGAKVTSLAFTADAVGGSTVTPDFDLMRTKVKKAIKKSEASKKKAASTATATANPSASATASTDSDSTGTKATATPTESANSTGDEDVSEVC